MVKSQMVLPVVVSAATFIGTNAFMFLMLLLGILIIIDLIKDRTGLKLSQKVYIDSLKHMKPRLSKEDYHVFFSMIVGLSNITLLRHLYLPKLEFYLKFHSSLVPEGYKASENEFLKMAQKYASLSTESRNAVTKTKFDIDWIATFHVCVVWMNYLGLTESQLDVLESITSKTSPLILGMQVLRIEFLYASLINGQTKDLNVSALNLYTSPKTFEMFFPGLSPEMGKILESLYHEISIEDLLKLKREFLAETEPDSELLKPGSESESKLRLHFTPLDLFYLVNRAHYKSIDLINALEIKTQTDLKLDYCRTNYFWPGKTRPVPRYNILIIGESGAGKSTFINSVYNYATYSDPSQLYKDKTMPIINPSLEDFESDKDYLFVNLILVVNSMVQKHLDSETIKGLESKETMSKTSEFYLSQLLDNSEPPVNEQDSSFINNNRYIGERFHSILLGKDLPDKKDQSKSVTQQCTAYPIYFNDKIVQFIDTPGLNDTEAGIKDSLNLKIINDYLKNVAEIHFVLFVVNANITRIRSFVGDYLQLFDKESLVQDSKPLFGFMFTHISQESIHTIHSLTEAISIELFKKDIKAPIFTCDNSILQTMKDRFKGGSGSKSGSQKFTALWNHNTSDLVKCIDNITESRFLRPKAFAPESNGIVMFEYPYLARYNNSLYPFEMLDFVDTPIQRIYKDKLAGRAQPFRIDAIQFGDLLQLKAMRRVLFFISRERLSEKSTSNVLKLEKRYLLWQIQQLQQLQLPDIPIKPTRKNIFMTHLQVAEYLRQTLTEQNLTSLRTELHDYKYRSSIVPPGKQTYQQMEDPAYNTSTEPKLISTETAIDNCRKIISELSDTKTGPFVQMLLKHPIIDLQRLGVWRMHNGAATPTPIPSSGGMFGGLFGKITSSFSSWMN